MSVLCILAAGRGTRANCSLHKALLPIGNRAILSRIMDKTTGDVVIAVGHQKDIIKEYCAAAHPGRNIRFVDVDNYEDPGSGPGYSLQCCKDHLQQPFYLSTADCLVTEDWPSLDNNWLGIYPITWPRDWATVQVKDSMITHLVNKRVDGFYDAWIGLCGIKNYNTFWEELSIPSKDKEFEIVRAFYNPTKYPLHAVRLTWHDTGTQGNYTTTKKAFNATDLALAKSDEFIYHCADRCIKCFDDPTKVEGRIRRAKILDKLTPEIVFSGKNIYAYQWQEGKTLYEHNNVDLFCGLLDWCDERVWDGVEAKDFSKHCYSFYYEKTIKRLKAYRYTDKLLYQVNSLDWNWLSDGIPVNFHGDLQYDNVLYDKDYCLIDWRDGFDGLDYGDLYYDLGKLYAGIRVSMYGLKCGKFNEKTEELVKAEHHFKDWIRSKGLDFKKVNVISALIFLNMAPLHPYPVNDFLYHYGRVALNDSIL